MRQIRRIYPFVRRDAVLVSSALRRSDSVKSVLQNLVFGSYPPQHVALRVRLVAARTCVFLCVCLGDAALAARRSNTIGKRKPRPALQERIRGATRRLSKTLLATDRGCS